MTEYIINYMGMAHHVFAESEAEAYRMVREMYGMN